MLLEPGRRYFRKRGVLATVRAVVSVTGDVVAYRVLHGPALKRAPLGSCSVKKFLAWADGAFSGDDFARLDGARLTPTYLMQNVAGAPLFRCGERRANFYLTKGYAVRVDAGTLRLVDPTTERKLAELYGEQLGAFFLEVKNDHCVVCGKDHALTRHHVVPKRHKKKLPPDVRSRLSNVLFVCIDCHDSYERQQLVSESLDPFVWKDHFVTTMRPGFLPAGWDIVLGSSGA